MGIGLWLRERGELQASPELVGACAQAATLAHDIGNPPFGHPGEAAIQDWFKEERKNPNNLTLSDTEVRDFTEFNGNAPGVSGSHTVLTRV
jgi:dGTP triphosphohydrolase